MPVRLAVFGAGKWAQTIISVLRQKENVQVSAILAKDAAKIRGWAGSAPVYTDINKLYDEQDVDGVVICTPPESHLELSLSALSRKLPCFLEKPAALSLRDVKLIQAKARAMGVPVVVDYIHLYSASFQHLVKECSVRPRPQKVLALAGNTQTRARDCSLLWDWGAHDIAMCLSCLGTGDVCVESADVWPKNETPFDSVRLHLGWDGIPVKLRLSERLNRKARVFAVKYENEVLIYNGLPPHSFTHLRRVGQGRYQRIDPEDRLSENQNPLSSALDHFISIIRNGASESVGLEPTIETTRILELCHRNIQAYG